MQVSLPNPPCLLIPHTASVAISFTPNFASVFRLSPNFYVPLHKNITRTMNTKSSCCCASCLLTCNIFVLQESNDLLKITQRCHLTSNLSSPPPRRELLVGRSEASCRDASTSDLTLFLQFTIFSALVALTVNQQCFHATQLFYT